MYVQLEEELFQTVWQNSYKAVLEQYVSARSNLTAV